MHPNRRDPTAAIGCIRMSSNTDSTHFHYAVIALAAAGLGLGGCGDETPSVPCSILSFSRTVQVTNVEEVDLLFMIDNSSSMAEEQASLAAEIPRLVSVLATGVNPDTGEEFPPVTSLRVGVVSSDLGTGPNGTCGSQYGDDGVLITSGNVTDASCLGTYPSWLDFAAELDDPNALARDVGCVATSLGTRGCDFEQPLDAILKALTPSTSGITFPGGTVGHGDGRNGGFVRPGSLLAIVALADEDDCSTTTTELFEEGHPTLDPNMDLRCFNHPELLAPVFRFSQGLLDLRADAPDRLVYATITGIPVDLVPDPGAPLAPQAANILADPRMVERLNPEDPSQLMPACEVPERGRALPGRRMIQVAADLYAAGAHGVVQSICQASFTGALDAIVSKIADELSGICLPRALNRSSSGEVECSVVEIIDTNLVAGGCAEIPGRVDDGLDEETGRPRCLVEQVVTDGASTPTSGAGWFYDDFSVDVLDRCADMPQRIAFTDGAEPRNGSELEVQCVQLVQGDGGEVGVGTSCAFDSEICANASASVLDDFPLGLVCDSAITATCRPLCASAADCPIGYICQDADGPGGPTPAFCVNPSCDSAASP